MTGTLRDTLRRLRPWLILALTVGMAAWHVIDFPDDIDREYPGVQRPTFSRRPPPAYRLADPGDTIDRIAIYTASIALVIAATGLVSRRRRPGLWPSALALALGAFWYAANPGPTFDGWHGLGWRAIVHPETPTALRISLAVAAILLAGLVVGPLLANRSRLLEFWRRACERQAAALFVVALILSLFRQVEIPGVEPVGYWPRWALVLALIAFDLALLRVLTPLGVRSWPGRAGLGLLGATAWFALVAGGIGLTWYHRPLARLRTVEPGKIYICAMPTRRGLEVAQRRHHFKTIINLFPEDTPLRSPLLPDELEFAREHGIHYLGSPSDAASSEAFLNETLRLARDPEAWPILLHCHGCMDRTPAWMGIYRFVVQKRPLDEILREIEQHRGYRPKASVVLLYNRVLRPRAPEHYASDPTAALLQRCAVGTRDPYEDQVRAELRRARSGVPPRLSQRTRTP
jgi:Tyrosine phosphatase family